MVDSIPALQLHPISGAAVAPIEVEADTSITVGRSLTCQYTLVDESVSRRHAIFAHEGGRWLLTDLDSRHGTYLNAVRLQANRPAVLGPGDLVRLGPYTFSVGAGETASFLTSTTDEPGTQSLNVEAVEERDLGQLARHRLDLLVDCASLIHGATDEASLADAVLESALAGTGFHLAALLRPHGGTDIEVLGQRHRVVEQQDDPAGFSRSLIDEASAGHVARLTEARQTTSESIVQLGITAALCAPIMLGVSVAGYLYLDARGRASAVEPDAAGFCQVIARMCGLALSNLRRVELERRQALLDADLAAARQAQQFIVPAEEGTAGAVRYAMLMRPGNLVAGDLFEVIELDENRTVVCIGDVTGEGVGAAVIMAAAQSHLHGALRSTGHLGLAVNTANRYLSRRTPDDRFISLWVGIFDRQAGMLSFVDAGHGHWLYNAAGGDPVFSDHRGGGIPLGIDAGFVYEPEQQLIAPGDRVLLWSDGLVEQTSSAGEQFGQQRLAEIVGKCADPGEDVQRVVDAFNAFAEGAALKDDTTVASVEVLAQQKSA